MRRSISSGVALYSAVCALMLSACGQLADDSEARAAGEVRRPEHGGRLLFEEDVALELALNEATGGADFRAWVTDHGVDVAPEEADLTVELARLGGLSERVQFTPAGEYLAGDQVIREPHSFAVSVILGYNGRTYRWQYDNFEGRSEIDPSMAEKFGLEAELAGPAEIVQTIRVFGQILLDPTRYVEVQARFPGVIRSVAVQEGDRVQAGAVLAAVESDESLKSYSVTTPQSGIIVSRLANPGEQTDGRTLFRILDPSRVWAELRLFPSQREKAQLGQSVRLTDAAGNPIGEGVIDWVDLKSRSDQSVGARVTLANPDGRLLPGMHLAAEIAVATHAVPLAVRRSGLQSFRDFTVVYAKVGDIYEVRMLTLGRQDAERVEVLSGLQPGERYVTQNSYLIKADIDKDSAAHDH